MPLWKPIKLEPQWTHSVLLCALIIPVLLLTSYAMNRLRQESWNEDRMRIAATDIREQVGGIRALMASLVGLHQSSTVPRGAALNLLSEQVREHAEYVSSIGRYDKVSRDDRSSFEADSTNTGILSLRIKGVDENGRKIELSDAPWYYPISMLEPLLPSNARLLGSDLRSLKGFEQALNTITKKNDTLLTSFPSSWPYGGQLLLFKPVYLGQLQPQTDAARLQQAAGGFWMSIDVRKLLSAITARMGDFDIKVVVQRDDIQSPLYEQTARHEQPLYLRFLFPRQRFSEQWTTGSSSLTIRFERENGYTAMALVVSVLIAVALLVILWQLISFRTARRNSEQQQQLSREALYDVREMAERTLNAVQDAIITLDADLRISHINPAAVILFNAKPNDTLGRAFDDLIQLRLADDQDTLLDLQTALDNLANSSQGEFDVIPVAGTRADFTLKLTLTSSHNNEGAVIGHVLVMRNISHERRLSEKLAYQANHDALTGCYNRYYFEQKLAGLIDEMSFSDSRHTLCYMDLDQFKIINDTCGHRAGDRLLVELTEHLGSIIREQDILSRLGGDEFGLILTDVDPDLAQTISNRLFKLFQGFIFRHEEKSFAVRASIGVVNMDSSSSNLKDVMAAADIACYAAKDAGRNSMYVYSPDDDAVKERTSELSWLPRLQNALQNDEFVLHMQPLAFIGPAPSGSPPDRSTSSQHFEFLLRLRNADGTEFTPWQFIRAAERYDLMRQIDRWVIRTALRTASELSGGPAGNCSYSINLSGHSTADPTLASYIVEQFDHYKVDPGRIWFEVTETAAISHFSIAIDLFNSIRELGCLIALDDFGSGLSSFGYLKSLPIDIIKIDRQYIQDIVTNKFDRHMVMAIQQLSQTMGVRIVAEFVENQEILDELTHIGIDYAQGFHIGKPATIEETMTRYLETRRPTGT